MIVKIYAKNCLNFTKKSSFVPFWRVLYLFADVFGDDNLLFCLPLSWFWLIFALGR